MEKSILGERSATFVNAKSGGKPGTESGISGVNIGEGTGHLHTGGTKANENGKRCRVYIFIMYKLQLVKFRS